MRECKNIGVSHVSLVDRAELIAWFKETDSMDVVSHMAPDPGILFLSFFLILPSFFVLSSHSSTSFFVIYIRPIPLFSEGFIAWFKESDSMEVVSHMAPDPGILFLSFFLILPSFFVLSSHSSTSFFFIYIRPISLFSEGFIAWFKESDSMDGVSHMAPDPSILLLSLLISSSFSLLFWLSSHSSTFFHLFLFLSFPFFFIYILPILILSFYIILFLALLISSSFYLLFLVILSFFHFFLFFITKII
jgi:hypothetical protein